MGKPGKDKARGSAETTPRHSKQPEMEKFLRKTPRLVAQKGPNMAESAAHDSDVGDLSDAGSGSDTSDRRPREPPMSERTLRRVLESALSPIKQDLSDIKDDLRHLGQRVVALEEAQESIMSYENKASEVLAAHKTLLNEAFLKLEDQENRSRRRNIRIRGLPESIAAEALPTVAREIFSMLLDPERAAGIVVERIHRALRPRPKPQEPPRDVICGLLSYVDTAALLKKQREMEVLEYEGTPFQMFQDLAPSTLAKRRLMKPLLDVLRKTSTPFRWLYPFGLAVSRNVASLNVHGLNEPCKRSQIISLLLKDKVSVAFLQETHFRTGKIPNLPPKKFAQWFHSTHDSASKGDPKGKTHKSTPDIAKTFCAFYEALYNLPSPEGATAGDLSEATDRFLQTLDLPSVSPSKASQLTRPITDSEIHKVLSTIPSGKSPGPDGFSITYYKSFKDILVPRFRDLCNFLLSGGSLAPHSLMAHITVLHKENKDPTCCSNYRPISLLNCDVKWWAKILAARLQDVLPDIVHEEQVGFVRGRQGSENTVRLLHLVNWAKRFSKPLVLAVSSCDEIPECQTISVQASTFQISVTGLAEGFSLQNITDIDGNIIQASDNSLNNTSLMSLRSGTRYVIRYGNDSTSCCRNVTTEPMSVKSLQISNATSSSVSLTWSKPDEYQTSYSYRVQTNLTSSSVMINDTIGRSDSATIMNLTAGETYTFMVYTRAADGTTESDPVSQSTCTVPGQVSSLSLTNSKSVDLLGATWTKPAGKVDNYTVSLTGAVNKTIPASTTQVNFTGLLPGREYTVTVQTVSGSCSQTSAPVTEATYPTEPGKLSFISIGTKNLTLSWTEPVNMTGVAKSYNISYGMFPSTNITVTSNATNVTLQKLTSGTNYSITVVTVGVRGYPSSPVSTSVYTKPMTANSLQFSDVTSSSVSLTWSKPDEYQTSYSYRVQTNLTSSSVMINNTIVRSESATITMNLIPGETYTFTVYTRAADDITESDPVSLTICIVPGQVSSLSLTNSKSVDFLGATWTKPAGKVDNYTVSLTGAVNKIIPTSTTQVNVTGLLPGREYTVTVQTGSGSCSQMSAPVTEATYPTQPGKLSLISIETKNLTLSWTEPVNMSGVTKSYTIRYGMFPSTNVTVTSNATNVILQKLTSGTNYSITVVTVGVRGYPSSPVSTSVYTKPMSVNSPQISNVTSSSVSLTWSKPDEYQTSYSYRVQTNLTSSSVMINYTIVRSESATIMNLTAGETYTFMVYTRAADDITESDPVSLTTCTVPGQVSSLSLTNYKSVDFLGATWTKPAGKVDNYTVSLTGAVNKTIATSTTQVNFTGLLPGREYTVTVQTVSGSCSQTSAPVTEATYPTQPGKLSFISIGTKNLTLSWTEPVNMNGVTKSYNIRYGMFPSTNITVTSNAANVTLQNLTSGTNYSITVVTVGVRGYPSSPVSTSVYTKPMSVNSLQISNVTSSSVSLTWSKPDEYQTSYSYRVQTNLTSSSVMINDTIVRSESATIMNLIPGETYTIMVYTRAADDITESEPVSQSTCTAPGQVSSLSLTNYKSVDFLGATWTKPAGKVDNYTVSLTGDVNKTISTNTTQVNFTGLLPGREYTVTVQTVSVNCSQTSAPVTEATYPTQPGKLSFISIRTKNLTLSWTEPVNMTGVTKSYNISYGMFPSTNITVTSSATNVTLQKLTSGTNYSITVVTVGVRGYPSSPVSTSVYTKPMSVNSPQISNVTLSSVSLTWSKPEEYQTSYSYRVQTNLTSSSVMINDTIVRSESATIMNLTAGETYTFIVYTRAADGITESEPVSRSTCIAPGQVTSISLNNYNSVDSLGATWTTKSAEYVDYYTVSLTGAVNKIIPANTTQVNFTGLLPGREYTVTVQTVSVNCSQTSAPVTEATYPTQPGMLSFISIGTKNLPLSWTEPVNMTGVTKSYNISYGMFPSTNITVTSNATNVTLQKLTSGTNYSVTVVTVGVRGYPSSPVSTSVYTKPMSVNSLQISDVTSSSVSLTWSKPDEYQTSYSYRVQTNLTLSSVMINYTIVRSESATIMNLTAGETYTFMVYTRAADNITESDPVSLTTCTVPGQVSSLSLNNSKSVDFLGATWTKPAGKVDNYTISLTGAVNKTIPASTTQVNFTGLLPGREYTVTVQTVSGNCSQTSAPVTEATYPTEPGKLSFISIGTKNLTLSWTEPVNMTDVMTKSYNISYGMFPSTNITVTSNATNVTLQNLTSGTNYSITVVTVGVRGYPSSPVSTSVYTKPMPVNSLQISDVTSSSVSLTWSKPDEYQTSYSYRVQTNLTLSSVVIKDTIVRSESATIMNLTAGETYTFMVYTRAADDTTESDPVSRSTYTALPDQPNTIQTSPPSSNGSMDITFLPFDSTHGTIVAYAVIITTEKNGNRPPWGILSKTYNDFNRLTNTYVTYIIDKTATMRSQRSNGIAVRVGDGTKTQSYVNGPLDPQSQYRVSIAGFNKIKYDPLTATIIEEQSPASFTNYTGPISLPTAPLVGPSNTGTIVGAVVGSVVGVSALIGVGFWFWRRHKKHSSENMKIRKRAKRENFEALFKNLQADDNKGFTMEFNSLQSVGVLQPRSVALHPANVEKNREDAAYPYDKSRVTLSTLENSSDGYINASYVPGYRSEKEFVAAQHPLPGTIKDFWYMIWEKRISTIVMLSNRRENYKRREEEYWPKVTKTFGNIIATLMSENIQTGWTVRVFMVRNIGRKESRQVRQFHFTEWHETGKMPERDTVIQFVHQVRQNKKENPSNYPTLVHCRTGMGRSGTFIALDCIINQLERDEIVDIFGAVQKMYLHRPLIVQTQEQYIFLHRCALDIVTGKTDHDYQKMDEDSLYEEIPKTTQEHEEEYERTLFV
ncbi:receptor-type tyrosine-protein phosphatase beta-like [Bufo gargarizans]|uniref:receptor-type tyrosine-protein phosphatase beta-like n=1 Tax=Bufo gargarizans TaxID=30331 RepID=UPI001CF2278F|nr:receptor-type tyrosine-protein phosphatase beta-like [Bufo gargarizans]